MRRALLIGPVVYADKPDPVTNCSVSHQSAESLQIACSEGFSGGIQQKFVLEIFAIDSASSAAAAAAAQETGSAISPGLPSANQTSARPVFTVRGLHPDTVYVAHVSAENAKGRSEPLVVRVVTLRPPETQKNIGPAKSEGMHNKSARSRCPATAERDVYRTRNGKASASLFGPGVIECCCFFAKNKSARESSARGNQRAEKETAPPSDTLRGFQWRHLIFVAENERLTTTRPRRRVNSISFRGVSDNLRRRARIERLFGSV